MLMTIVPVYLTDADITFEIEGEHYEIEGTFDPSDHDWVVYYYDKFGNCSHLNSGYLHTVTDAMNYIKQHARIKHLLVKEMWNHE